ncbi:TIP41-like family-domain-containing protein [Phlyctochytrium arcticum]|nr:TIP41-like family-domain-containing protein [Phlyctochytrium arcticum]
MTAATPPHKILRQGQESGIALQGWTILARKAPICNAGELERASEILPVPTPEMLFGNNHLTLHHDPSGVNISFKAIDALLRVDASASAAEGIKVSYADHWSKKSAAAHEKIKDVIKPYDWTYTTDYTGSISLYPPLSDSVSDPSLSDQQTQAPTPTPAPSLFKPTTTAEIDIERLKRPDPILFYDELVLFEDELADNGTAMLTVRVRVMPSCFFVLCRFFLRVDDVLFRINDTRIYHEFGTDQVIREFTSQEEEYSRVKAKLPKPAAWESHKKGAEDLSPLTDMNWVSGVLSSLSEDSSTSVPPSTSDVHSPGKRTCIREAISLSTILEQSNTLGGLVAEA